jgi:hypothetical protein
MPGRAVEAMLLTAIGIALTILVFMFLRPYLFPEKGLELQLIGDNIINLAQILDKGGGKFYSKSMYVLQSNGSLLRINITVFPSKEAKVYTISLPVIKTHISGVKTLILRGDPSPYTNLTKLALVTTNNNVVETIARPVIQIEDCNFYGFNGKFIRITFTKLTIEHANKILENFTVTQGSTVDFFLNNTYQLPVEINYGKNISIIFEILDSNGNIMNVLDIPLRREIKIDQDTYGVFLIQYTFDEIVAKV